MSLFPDIVQEFPAWTERRLKALLSDCLDQDEVRLRLTIMLDGLDEFGDQTPGAQEELLDWLAKITKRDNFRCILSSRPMHSLETKLKSHPKLQLQDLTRSDIQTYVQDSLREADAEDSSKGPEQLDQLTNRIVERSQGVFLWSRIAVMSVKEGLQNGDDMQQLTQRVSLLPGEIEDMYTFMYNSIPSIYRREATRYMELVSNAQHSLTLLDITLASYDVAGMMRFEVGAKTYQDVLQSCHTTKTRVLATCAGFLEVRSRSDIGYVEIDETNHEERAVQALDSLDDYRSRAYVAFMHATAQNFFEACIRGSDDGSPQYPEPEWSVHRQLAISCAVQFELIASADEGKRHATVTEPLKALDYSG